jgi:hypothetical protein
MSYAQNVINNQLASNRSNNDFGEFNVNDITAAQMDKLRNDVYGGFKTKDVARYEMRGAGSGRSSVQTGYDSVFNKDYYREHAGWSSIGDKLGININSQNDVRQLYDFVNGYKPPAAATAPAAPAAPAPLMPQISAASQQYRADTQALSDKIAKQQADFNASQAAATKAREIAEQARITGIRTAAANQARSGQAPNLQIQPASSTPLTAGTGAFRIRKRRGTEQQQLASSLNIGQSNTLNI